jgi:hypothetical protein
LVICHITSLNRQAIRQGFWQFLTVSISFIILQKQKILNEKVELSEKLKDFERKGNHWLEPHFAGAESFCSCRNAVENTGKKETKPKLTKLPAACGGGQKTLTARGQKISSP